MLNNIIGFTKKEKIGLFVRQATLDDVEVLTNLINFSYRGTISTDSDRNAPLSWTNETHYIGGKRLDNQSLAREIKKQSDDVMLYFVLELRNSNNNIDTSEKDGATGNNNNSKNKPIASIRIDRDNDIAYIGTFSVDSKLQSDGVGGVLMRFAELYIKANWIQVKEIVLYVVSIRYELLKWYQNIGYTLTSETRPFFNPDHDSVPFVDGIVFSKLTKNMLSVVGISSDEIPKDHSILDQSEYDIDNFK
ncbi:hypothetical protein PPL_05937 [Heterostelium album PN500]|uniref:N-acetyltransferase domain-containing protein n=1 Tax=Heterostelium pallidum (strain ATCC 26659 / Pp 5 / PN500) TaxID=670386 RepID=D3BBR8_HETP5|nr:hypothetical protein PPL_05937 [Heterostelium album PN500]EFA81101.1 hypothetical protein PPL_05937 [Heterostelium album PN500]|eukprot:XP_020433219.1 hypothetical protein PPL_05937 [Heterostelium album PN500]